MNDIKLERPADVKKVRTALYMDVELKAAFDRFAKDNGVSFNRASVYLMRLGLDACGATKAAKKVARAR